MIIRLFNSDQYFDLPEGIQFSVELNSPFFSEQGSLTLPVKLPDTPHNRKLFGHANRLDVVTSGATDRVITTDLAVIVAVGSWQQHATLSLISYSSEGFECGRVFDMNTVIRACIVRASFS